jgi:hypothetical protein
MMENFTGRTGLSGESAETLLDDQVHICVAAFIHYTDRGLVDPQSSRLAQAHQ